LLNALPRGGSSTFGAESTTPLHNPKEKMKEKYSNLRNVARDIHQP
jgi:hypothetical protein